MVGWISETAFQGGDHLALHRLSPRWLMSRHLSVRGEVSSALAVCKKIEILKFPLTTAAFTLSYHAGSCEHCYRFQPAPLAAVSARRPSW